MWIWMQEKNLKTELISTEIENFKMIVGFHFVVSFDFPKHRLLTSWVLFLLKICLKKLGSRWSRVEICALEAVDELLWRGLHPATALQRHHQPQVGVLLRERDPGAAGQALQPAQIAQSEHAAAGHRRKRPSRGEPQIDC